MQSFEHTHETEKMKLSTLLTFQRNTIENCSESIMHWILLTKSSGTKISNQTKTAKQIEKYNEFDRFKTIIIITTTQKSIRISESERV